MILLVKRLTTTNTKSEQIRILHLYSTIIIKISIFINYDKCHVQI